MQKIASRKITKKIATFLNRLYNADDRERSL
jgi:hypothetical protein